MNENKRINGKIIKLNPNGWGFISSDEMKFVRIFFHWTALEPFTLKFQELKIGMKVKFVPVDFHDFGWRALKIEVIQRKWNPNTSKQEDQSAQS